MTTLYTFDWPAIVFLFVVVVVHVNLALGQRASARATASRVTYRGRAVVVSIVDVCACRGTRLVAPEELDDGKPRRRND